MSPAIYQELRDSTISSFLKFIAQRYKAAPVKTGIRAIKVPESESCSQCNSEMTLKQRVDSHSFVRIFWHCPKCNCDARKEYGEIETNRERRMQRHWSAFWLCYRPHCFESTTHFRVASRTQATDRHLRFLQSRSPTASIAVRRAPFPVFSLQ